MVANTPDPGFEVDGGPDLSFDFDADLTEHAQNYRDQDLVNLFYWCNVIHDVMYGYGFNEESGNFQATNYTGQGVGGDAVNCEGADGGGTNNANFATPAADGGAPRMQMFLWPGNQFGSQNQLVIDGVGAFGGNFARFSAAPTNAGLSGEIVDAGNGCDAAQYPATLPDGDWIALVATGTCNNVVKGQVAQAQGASAAVVTGTTAILTGPITLPRVEIPMMSLSTADGDPVRAALPVTGTVRKHPDHPGIRSGDLDNGIIIHEYGHGISNRLVGGPGINCIGGDERMGEGWSDYYAITMLIDPELDDFDGPRGLVPYSLFQPNRQGNGLRPRPYSRTWDIQPFSYDSIKTGGWLGGASLAAPHGIGHGWNSVLMDMTWDLIDKHGFNPNLYEPWHTGGNNLAMQLVTDGLKIQGCNPTFVVGRDAILTADEALTGGENQCTIWASFARRGLGYSADDGGTTGRNDGTEAFDTHPDCANDFAGLVTAQPAVNTVTAGRTVPMVFNRPELSGLDVLAPNSPFSRRVDCETFAVPSDDPPRITPRAAPVAAMTAGDSSLTRSTNGRYTFRWQTQEDWVDTCREFVLTLQNGEQHRAYFRFVEAED
ncbi:MAG TPA: M36 family metallopeptidase [Jiangellaceae bacterium]|nr:M36 family metallopeptidase [Jiangellaceae bacterium]